MQININSYVETPYWGANVADKLGIVFTGQPIINKKIKDKVDENVFEYGTLTVPDDWNTHRVNEHIKLILDEQKRPRMVMTQYRFKHAKSSKRYITQIVLIKRFTMKPLALEEASENTAVWSIIDNYEYYAKRYLEKPKDPTATGVKHLFEIDNGAFVGYTLSNQIAQWFKDTYNMGDYEIDGNFTSYWDLPIISGETLCLPSPMQSKH